MQVPEWLAPLAERVAAEGGEAWLVGGWVRDRLLGRDAKDIDVEVHGLAEDRLEALLGELGSVNAVGRSFGVFKLMLPGGEVDVSLPRRDSKAGAGHRGIRVEGDPHMGLREASRRRDLTFNALMVNARTGEIVDLHGGLDDLRAGVLREVDAQTFVEDPLRALRAVQLAARLGFTLAPSLEALLREARLGELPAERIWGELEKLLLKAEAPGAGLATARRLGLLGQVLPELAEVVDGALCEGVDRAAARRAGLTGRPRQTGLMVAALLHRLDDAGRVASLDRLQLHSLLRWPLRRVVLEGLALLDAPPPFTDARLRALADRYELRFVLTLLDALQPGAGAEATLARAEALGVADGPLPRLLSGRALQRLGVPPGPALGALLDELRNAQHEGVLCSPEQAEAWVRRRAGGAG